MQVSLKTLLVVFAAGPPALAVVWSDSSIPLAVFGWLGLLAFALFVGMSDARQHSRYRRQ